jgi:hypothetical protein
MTYEQCKQWVNGRSYQQLLNEYDEGRFRSGSSILNDISLAVSHGLVQPPSGSATGSTVPATPAGTSSSSSGGSTMTTSASTTPETTQLAKAAIGIGEMDPATAWELDAQLQGMARAMFQLSEGLGQWIETLDAIKTDPRVTSQAGVAVGEIAEVVRTFSVTRQLFRNLYAAQFAAAEAGVRQVQRQNFFNPNAA